MPLITLFDASLPLLAHTLTLTAALLSAWQHEGTILGEYSLQDALRMDTQRIRHMDIPSVEVTL